MKTLSCAAILLLCYVFPAHAQLVPANCATPPSTFNSVWYIDPVHGATATAGGNGSQKNPWNSLQAVFQPLTGYTYPLLTTAPYRYWPAGAPGYEFKPGPGAGPIKPGDEILLMSGNYGNIWIGNPGSEISNSSFLTITAAPGQTPVLTSLFIYSTNMLQFNGLKVQSLSPATLSGNWLVEVKDQGAALPTSDIVFENMTISSQDDVSGWTQAQWVANARNGFFAEAAAGAGGHTKCISMTGSHITNIRFGASLSAGPLLFSGNEIDHFGDDGIDYAASNLTITKNYIHDAINIGDGNHPDAMQGVVGVIAPGVAANTYEYVLIDSNTIIRQVDPKLPWPNFLQGIDAFNSDWMNLTVTNNVVITSACNGITFSSVQGGLIANNTLVDDGLLASAGGCKPAIGVGASTSGGSPSKLVAVRNNLASAISIDNLLVDVEADHNVGMQTPGPVFAWSVNGVTQFYGAAGTYGDDNMIAPGGPAAEFVDFDPSTLTYNVMLKNSAPAKGFGATAGAPTVDILGITRSSTYCPCAGAYGYPN